MKIGIISDIHDNLRHLDRVGSELNQLGISLLIICGDFDMSFTLRGLLKFKCPIKGVMGNGDPCIQKFLYQLQTHEVLQPLKSNLELKTQLHDFKIDNCRIAVLHGEDHDLNNALIESQLYDVICLGHTHKAGITTSGKTIIINPGTLVGWTSETNGATPYSYAVFDSISREAEIFEIA